MSLERVKVSDMVDSQMPPIFIVNFAFTKMLSAFLIVNPGSFLKFEE